MNPPSVEVLRQHTIALNNALATNNPTAEQVQNVQSGLTLNAELANNAAVRPQLFALQTSIRNMLDQRRHELQTNVATDLDQLSQRLLRVHNISDAPLQTQSSTVNELGNNVLQSSYSPYGWFRQAGLGRIGSTVATVGSAIVAALALKKVWGWLTGGARRTRGVLDSFWGKLAAGAGLLGLGYWLGGRGNPQEQEKMKKQQEEEKKQVEAVLKQLPAGDVNFNNPLLTNADPELAPNLLLLQRNFIFGAATVGFERVNPMAEPGYYAFRVGQPPRLFRAEATVPIFGVDTQLNLGSLLTRARRFTATHNNVTTEYLRLDGNQFANQLIRADAIAPMMATLAASPANTPQTVQMIRIEESTDAALPIAFTIPGTPVRNFRTLPPRAVVFTEVPRTS